MKYPAIDPVAFSLGPLDIRWYALAYLAGILLGWRYILHINRLDKDSRITKTDIDDFLLWAVVGIIAGGRIGYVLFYQAGMYLEEPLEVFRLWNGGMSFHGGAAGVIIAMIAFALKRKLPLLRLTDMVCAAVPIGVFFGRIANFINGELWGRVSDAPWAVVFPRAGEAARHPSQLYEAGLEGLFLGLILAVMIHIKAVRDRPGLVSAAFLTGYAAARSFVEFFREPDAQIGFLFGGVTMGQMLCLPLVLGALALIIYDARRRNHDSA